MRYTCFNRFTIGAWMVLCAMAVLAADTDANAKDLPVSFFKQVMPVLKQRCTGCHHPGKLKGKLDLTRYATFKKGGETGAPFVAGEPNKSLVVE